jgi:ABC-type dipeptide/oligopeptide/nickel transport system ATPase subunit
MNPWLLIAAGVFWVLSVGGAYVKGQGAGANRVIAGQASADQVRRDTIEAAQQGAAKAIAALKPINTTIVQKTQKEVRENTIYRDCRVPASGVQLANEAITARPAQPSGGQQLPGANPAPR